MQESIRKDGRRATANEYLKVARMRKSVQCEDTSMNHDDIRDENSKYGLDIWTSIHTRRIIFEFKGAEELPTAVAVETELGIVRASKEIVSDSLNSY